MRRGKQLTEWMYGEDAMPSGFYGDLSYLEWCRRERDRINREDCERDIFVAVEAGLVPRYCLMMSPQDKFHESTPNSSRLVEEADE